MLEFVYICISPNINRLDNSFVTNQLRNRFHDRKSFSRQELFAFYKEFEPFLKESTFRWRIHDLKQKKFLSVLSKDTFSLVYKPVFVPVINRPEEKLFLQVAKAFYGLRICTWSTQMLTEFMLHLPNRNLNILEVEKEALEPVYHFLKDKGINDIFLQPDRHEISRYIHDAKAPLVLLPLITKAPVQQVEKIITATLEKVIVDLFCEKDLYEAFQGNELAHIINSAYSKYVIDLTRLLNYAERRRKQGSLKKYLYDKTDILTNV